MPNLHSHAFQRGMAGLAETRGAVDRQLLDLARGDVPLRADDDAGRGRGGRGQLYVEMLEAGFSRVGEFHYLHHDRDGAPYANIAEMAERIAAAAGRDRHRR